MPKTFPGLHSGGRGFLVSFLASPTSLENFLVLTLKIQNGGQISDTHIGHEIAISSTIMCKHG